MTRDKIQGNVIFLTSVNERLPIERRCISNFIHLAIYVCDLKFLHDKGALGLCFSHGWHQTEFYLKNRRINVLPVLVPRLVFSLCSGILGGKQ